MYPIAIPTRTATTLPTSLFLKNGNLSQWKPEIAYSSQRMLTGVPIFHLPLIDRLETKFDSSRGTLALLHSQELSVHDFIKYEKWSSKRMVLWVAYVYRWTQTWTWEHKHESDLLTHLNVKEWSFFKILPILEELWSYHLASAFSILHLQWKMRGDSKLKNLKDMFIESIASD